MDYSVRTGNAFGALMKDPNAGKAKKKRNRKKKKKSKAKEAHAAVQTTPRGDEKIAESEPEEDIENSPSPSSPASTLKPTVDNNLQPAKMVETLDPSQAKSFEMQRHSRKKQARASRKAAAKAEKGTMVGQGEVEGKGRMSLEEKVVEKLKSLRYAEDQIREAYRACEGKEGGQTVQGVLKEIQRLERERLFKQLDKDEDEGKEQNLKAMRRSPTPRGQPGNPSQPSQPKPQPEAKSPAKSLKSAKSAKSVKSAKSTKLAKSPRRSVQSQPQAKAAKEEVEDEHEVEHKHQVEHEHEHQVEHEHEHEVEDEQEVEDEH
ncbi:hypothetical protein AAMO2058_001705100, partial [Amorphochlora amoebiformis]